MARKHKPRSGSLAFYPRVRAKKETPSFRTFPSIEKPKLLNFIGYKAGMVSIFAKSEADKTTAMGKEIVIPCTVIECPPVKIFGIRAYEQKIYGKRALGEIWEEKHDKNFSRKIKGSSTKKKEKKDKKAPKFSTMADLEKAKESIYELKLLAHSNPNLTGIGKKKPDFMELALSGTIDEQFGMAKEYFGKEISLSEVFQEKQFIDVKAVTKGKGFQGPVKRYGIKIQRPKAKKHRAVGSISPWTPSTIMWTVPRPGKMGYHSRTEYNKRILMLSNKTEKVNPQGGFGYYGSVKNDFILVAGSVPGPFKRAIALREPMRKTNKKKWKIGEISEISRVKAE